MVYPENQDLVGKCCLLSLPILHYLLWEWIEYSMKWKCSIYIAEVNSFTEWTCSFILCVCQRPDVPITIILVTLFDRLMNFRQVLIALTADTHLTYGHLCMHTQWTLICVHRTVTFDIY